MHLARRKYLIGACAFAATSVVPELVLATDLPGHGITVQPTGNPTPTGRFQSLIIETGLRQLGYAVKEFLPADPAIFHLAVAKGDATFSAHEWTPLYDEYFKKAGGDAVCMRLGNLISDCIFGYAIDKKTADSHNITNLSQFKDASISRLFNMTGMGDAADLVAGSPGWGAAKVLQHHMQLYSLKDHIQLQFGNYEALMANVLQRMKSGQPVFYYTWVPLWVSNVLVPGRDVTWLSVPFPDPENGKNISRLPDGRDTGFPIYTVKILANKEFLQKNPAAKTFFEQVTISAADISAENMLMQKGENKPSDVMRHAQTWIAAHKTEFDTWIANAMRSV